MRERGRKRAKHRRRATFQKRQKFSSEGCAAPILSVMRGRAAAAVVAAAAAATNEIHVMKVRSTFVEKYFSDFQARDAGANFQARDAGANFQAGDAGANFEGDARPPCGLGAAAATTTTTTTTTIYIQLVI